MSATPATVIAGNGAGRAQQPVGMQLEELFDSVDDLIRRVADIENPEILKVRARVYAALVAAKSAFEDGVIQVHPQAVPVADGADEHLNDYPGQSLGVALLVGLGLGLIVSLRQ